MHQHFSQIGIALIFSASIVALPSARAQQSNPNDAAIDAMRARAAFSPGDQGRMADWTKAEVDGFSGFAAFRKRISTQYKNPANSAAFKTELARKLTHSATTRLPNRRTPSDLARALAQVLVDLDRAEVIPGLLAGLKSTTPAARLLCVRGLSSPIQRREIKADPNLLNRVRDGLSAAGLAETELVILRRIYEALNYPNQVAAVFDTYIRLFDKRLTQRRAIPMSGEGSELWAYDFFRSPEVVAGLNQAQKVDLVGRLAVFLRDDAQRYANLSLSFSQADAVERTLDGAEEILVAVTGTTGGKIRDQLSKSAVENRAAVLQEAYKWVGDSKSGTRGVLQAAPWNVPVGAP